MAITYIENSLLVNQRRVGKPLGDPKAWQFIPLGALAAVAAGAALAVGLLPFGIGALAFAVYFAAMYRIQRPRAGDDKPYVVSDKGMGGPRFPNGFLSYDEIDRVESKRDGAGNGGFRVYQKEGRSVVVPGAWLLDPAGYWDAVRANFDNASGVPWT